MKNYRVGFKKGGNVTDVSVGPWKEKQKPKPGPKPGPGKREKLKKGRDFMEDPYRRKGREGREAPKVKPDPRAPSRPKKTWPPKHSDLLKRYPKMPQPHKSPGDIPYIPMPKHDPNKPKKWKPAAEGGRIGLKKGGPKPGTHDYFLLHKREKKAGGGTLLKQTVKKVAKKIKAKKDTESVRDVRAEGGRSTKISKRGPVYNKNTGRKIIR